MKTQQQFAGRVVVISGGGRGIGLATAKAFARAGARVAIGDIDAELAKTAASQINGFGGYLDVRSQQSFVDFIQQTEAVLGAVDILVNNAGIMPMGAFVDESAAISDAQIDINLRGVIHGMKAVLPKMQARQHGHIVNVASLAGRFPIPGASVYCATKFAVIGLTSSMREELRDTPIGVSVVMPSKVSTELSSGTGKASIPTVSPEDVAYAIMMAVRENLAEVAVPQYLSTVATAYGVTPSWLIRPLRRLMKDNIVLTSLDRSARKGYEDRVNQLADHPATTEH
ncbi:MAG: SDR family oxidoreductase [Gammaproteobacteria bacterium]|nr:SDR family oxidoreductase [Gammaproteobacteria bacterium]